MAGTPGTLFHYTDLPALALILRNRTIRFTRLDKVDDPQEMRTADSRNLAKFRFVSCWTDSAEESIPMWREYAGTDSGVRIELPADPFARYDLTEEDRRLADGITLEGGWGKGLRLPMSEVWDKGVFVPEAAGGAEILCKVSYTDDPALLFPKVIEQSADGGLSANIGAVGAVKSTAWSYQREWRYVLTVFPFGLREARDFQRDVVGRLAEMVLDRRDPNLPESLDMRISDEVFGAMGITASPAMTEGARTILDALVDKYNPCASVRDSALEL